MNTETVEGVVDGQKVSLVVRRANVLIGTHRYALIKEGAKTFGLSNEDDLVPPAGVDADLFNLRVFSFANLSCCTVSAEGLPWPMTFDQFVDLDEALWNRWSDAVRRQNPHWYPAVDSADPKV